MFKVNPKQRIPIISTLAFYAFLQAANVSAQTFMEQDNNVPVGMSKELSELHKANKESLRATGVISKKNELQRAKYIEKQMDIRREHARSLGKEGDPRTLGFYRFEDVNEETVSRLLFEPTLPEERFIEQSSEKYVLVGGNRVKQFYKNSNFGSLIIDEYTNTITQLDSPNIVVGGHDATKVYYEYRDSEWGTSLYIPMGERLFILEAGRKLEGSEFSRFLEMAEMLVSRAK